ncbi:putative rRNA small subunit methyltransferase G [Helianthus annuus]|nr:putative rRNA small subunit methyltransferase G [Helianthus annuus]
MSRKANKQAEKTEIFVSDRFNRQCLPLQNPKSSTTATSPPLLDWNQKMNLTAVRDANDVMDKHIEDSLAIIPPI